jgi:hypothetical protein
LEVKQLIEASIIQQNAERHCWKSFSFVGYIALHEQRASESTVNQALYKHDVGSGRNGGSTGLFAQHYDAKSQASELLRFVVFHGEI